MELGGCGADPLDQGGVEQPRGSLRRGLFQPAWLRPTPVGWGDQCVLQDPDLGQGSGATLPAPSLLSAPVLGQGSGYSEFSTPVLGFLFLFCPIWYHMAD